MIFIEEVAFFFFFFCDFHMRKLGGSFGVVLRINLCCVVNVLFHVLQCQAVCAHLSCASMCVVTRRDMAQCGGVSMELRQWWSF